MAKKKPPTDDAPDTDPSVPSPVEPGVRGPIDVVLPPAERPFDPPAGTKVPGVRDHDLHATLHEAHRVLQVGLDALDKVKDQCEGQFIRPLLNAHDGDSATCVEVRRQIEAFRSLYR